MIKGTIYIKSSPMHGARFMLCLVDSLSLNVGVDQSTHCTATREFEWQTLQAQKEIVWWVSSSRVGRRESIFGLQENENQRKRKRAFEEEGEQRIYYNFKSM